MNYQLQRAIEEVKEITSRDKIEVKKLAYSLEKVQTEVERLEKDLNTKEVLIRLSNESRDKDRSFVLESLESKKLQLVFSFSVNVILVITICAMFLAERMK